LVSAGQPRDPDRQLVQPGAPALYPGPPGRGARDLDKLETEFFDTIPARNSATSCPLKPASGWPRASLPAWKIGCSPAIWMKPPRAVPDEQRALVLVRCSWPGTPPNGPCACWNVSNRPSGPTAAPQLDRSPAAALSHPALSQPEREAASTKPCAWASRTTSAASSWMNPSCCLYCKPTLPASQDRFAAQLLSAFERRAAALQPAPNLLSPRELELLCLMAEGLSNQAIAARLVLGYPPSRVMSRAS